MEQTQFCTLLLTLLITWVGAHNLASYDDTDGIGRTTRKFCKGARDYDFREEALEEHNRIRARYGSPPLELDIELCKVAQGIAEKLVNIKGTWKGVNGNHYGTRYDSDACSDYTIKATKVWHSGRSNYNFDHPGPQDYYSGRFTRLVWKSSTKLGIGFAYKSTKDTFEDNIAVVAIYDPPGNIVGEYGDNVGRYVEK